MNNKHDDGGPAFPVVHAIVPAPGSYTSTPEAQPGASLLDLFTGFALAGLLAHKDSDEHQDDELARQALDMAAAVLREKRRREAASDE